MSVQDWGCDVPVSMPEPLPDTGLVPMFGFVFTQRGLFHDLSDADHERLAVPTYAPQSPMETVAGDDDLDEED